MVSDTVLSRSITVADCVPPGSSIFRVSGFTYGYRRSVPGPTSDDVDATGDRPWCNCIGLAVRRWLGFVLMGDSRPAITWTSLSRPGPSANLMPTRILLARYLRDPCKFHAKAASDCQTN